MRVRSIQVPSKCLPRFMVALDSESDEQLLNGTMRGATADKEDGDFTIDASSDEEDSGGMCSRLQFATVICMSP